jgi:Ser/Thr protein kinase RdoA (MazF antagonist)
VGKLHAVAGEYRPAAELRRPDWEEGENLFRSPTFADPNLAALAAAALERIRGLPQGPENYGMIHADLHFANFYVDVPARSITVFDFDDCCYGWYVMDLAVLLFDVLVLYEGPDREAFALDFMHSLLKGYRHEWTTDLAGMADFLKLLEVNMFGTLAPRYQPGQGWWSSRFMPGRGEAIQAGRPYVPLDFAGL